MYEWTDETIVHKAPPPAPDPERYKGCAITTVGMVGCAVLMFSLLTFGLIKLFN